MIEHPEEVGGSGRRIVDPDVRADAPKWRKKSSDPYNFRTAEQTATRKVDKQKKAKEPARPAPKAEEKPERSQRTTKQRKQSKDAPPAERPGKSGAAPRGTVPPSSGAPAYAANGPPVIPPNAGIPFPPPLPPPLPNPPAPAGVPPPFTVRIRVTPDVIERAQLLLRVAAPGAIYDKPVMILKIEDMLRDYVWSDQEKEDLWFTWVRKNLMEKPVVTTNKDEAEWATNIGVHHRPHTTIQASTHPFARLARVTAEKFTIDTAIKTSQARQLTRIVDYFGTDRNLALWKNITSVPNRILQVTPLTFAWFRPLLTIKDHVSYAAQLLITPSVTPGPTDFVLLTDIYLAPSVLLPEIADLGVTAASIATQIFHAHTIAGMHFGSMPYYVENGLVHQAPASGDHEWVPTPPNDEWISTNACAATAHTCMWDTYRRVSDYYILNIVFALGSHPIPPLSKVDDAKAILVEERIRPHGTLAKIKHFFDKFSWESLFTWDYKSIYDQRLTVFKPAADALKATMVYKTRQGYQLSSLTHEVTTILAKKEYEAFWLLSKYDRARVVADTVAFITWSEFAQEKTIWERALTCFGTDVGLFKTMRSKVFVAQIPRVDPRWYSWYAVAALIGIALIRRAPNPLYGALSLGNFWETLIPYISPLWTTSSPASAAIPSLPWTASFQSGATQFAQFATRRIQSITNVATTIVDSAQVLSTIPLPITEAFAPVATFFSGVSAVAQFAGTFILHRGALISAFIAGPLYMAICPQVEEALKRRFSLLTSSFLMASLEAQGTTPGEALRCWFYKFGLHSWFSASPAPALRHALWNAGVEAMSDRNTVGMLASLFSVGISVVSTPPSVVFREIALSATYPLAASVALQMLGHVPGMLNPWLGLLLGAVIWYFCRRSPSLPPPVSAELERFKAEYEVQNAHLVDFDSTIAVPLIHAHLPCSVNVPDLKDPRHPEGFTEPNNDPGMYILLGTTQMFHRPTGLAHFLNAFHKRNLLRTETGSVPSPLSEHCETLAPCRFGNYLDAEACPIGMAWLRATNFVTKVIRASTRLMQLEERPITRYEWAQKFDSASKRHRAMEGIALREQGSILTRSGVFLKGDEVLFPKQGGIKGRVVKSVDPTIQADCSVHIDAAMKRLKQIFNEKVSHRISAWTYTAAVGSGRTGSELDRWFEISLDWVRIGIRRIAFIVAGDDFYALVNETGTIFAVENDFSIYDRTQGAHALFSESRMLCALGFPPTVAARMFDAALSTAVYEHKPTNTRIRCKMPIQRATGGPDTTIGNTLNNIASVLYSLHRHCESQSSEELNLAHLQLELGFAAKVTRHEVFNHGTFLKGWWVLNVAGSFQWLPLPSQAVKLGKILTDPRSIYKHLPASLAWKAAAYAMARGYGLIPRDYPVFGVFLKFYDDLKPSCSFSIEAIELEAHKIVRDTEVLLNRDSVLDMIEHRYGITPYEVHQMEIEISSAPFPGLLVHPGWAAIASKDYG